MPDPIYEQMGTSEGAFALPLAITAAGTKSYLLATTNRFLDKDIRVVTSTEAAEFSKSNNVVYCSKAGYVTAGSASSGIATIGAGKVTSGSATISSATYIYDSNSGKFNVSGNASIGAPSVNTAGYISSSIGTRKGNTATLSTTVNKIVGSTTLSMNNGAATRVPSILKQVISITNVTDAANGNATTTPPSSGVYVAVKSTANTGTLNATPNVTTDGYGTSENHGILGNSITVGADASQVTYVPIKSAGTASLSISAISGTDAVSVGNKDSNNYYPITANNLSVTGNVSVTSSGWFTGANSLTDSDTDGSMVGKMLAATVTVTGTNTVSPSASLSGDNVTLSDTNNGISITATGGGTASVTAAANVTTAGYVPAGNSFTTNTLNAENNTTTKTQYISNVTVPSGKSFDVTNNGTITMTSSGTATITNSGTTTVTSSKATGVTVNIAAKATSSASSNTSKAVVENGIWKTTEASSATTYYGRVTVRSVTGTIGGSSSNGSATAAISNTNSMNTITTLTGLSAGTDYWQVQATATGTSGSYTPKYTVSTSGWIASDVTGTAQTVSVNSDTTGKSIYIPRATFTVNGGAITVNKAGYIPANASVATITSANIQAQSDAANPPSGYNKIDTNITVASGGYLKIDAGYIGNSYITLADIVPDEANIPYSTTSPFILDGKTAYDVDGQLITGGILTYQGYYTVS